MILIGVRGTHAAVRRQETLTVGMVGAVANFVFFDEKWDSLSKTAVFRQGDVTKDCAMTGDSAVIPWEVLRMPGVPVYIGVYGCTADGSVVIPTVWAKTAPVKAGTDPSGDESYPPTPDMVSQIYNAITYAGQNLVKTEDPFLRGGNVESVGKAVVLSYEDDKETTVRIATAENLVAGEQYVLSFDCANVPANKQGKSFRFKVGDAYFELENGRIVVPFKASATYDVSGSVLLDDTATASAGNRPTAAIVGDGIVLSNFSVERGTFSAGFHRNEKEYEKGLIPTLTTKQKGEIKALAKSYFDVGYATSGRDAVFHYDYNVVRNDYATSRCFGVKREETYQRFGLCCNTFVEMVWMGRKVTDFVGKTAGTYSHVIGKAFKWGYYFGFKDRENFSGVAERNDDGSIIRYYNYKNPHGYDSDNFEGSYSTNTYYDSTIVSLKNFPKQQWFKSFMTAGDVAQELYRMGCEIPFEELDVGDIVFTRPRYTLNSESETFYNNIGWRNISHVVLVYEKAADGTLTFMDCTDRGSKNQFIFTASVGDQSYMSNVAEAVEIINNVVMCARHPAAWGKNNMEGIDRIDYMPMRYTSGYSTNQAIQFVPGMAVTEDLWYFYDDELGKAKKTETAAAWNASYFDIQYTNAPEVSTNG